MKVKTLAAAAAISIASAGVASAETIRIGITQNNVGVDSYQTTYEKAFLEAAKADPNVEAVVLDATGACNADARRRAPGDGGDLLP